MKLLDVIGRREPLLHNGSSIALTILLFAGTASTVQAASDITRMWFTPPVVRRGFTGTVRFEATATGNPVSVAFEYNQVDRPMYDDGTHGDLVAGDSTWTILFRGDEILSKLTPTWVYRPFIGYCKPAGAGRYNIFAEIWTPDIGLVEIELLGPNAQRTDYLANFTATTSQLMNFDAMFWAKRFYGLYGDEFDFLLFLHVAGKRDNRSYGSVKNEVDGIGMSLFDDTARYGSLGRLKGYVVFPLSSFFDCGETVFSHEIGHKWINFLGDTPFESGIPHWPRGNIAINMMGFSMAGGVGGRYYYTFTSNDRGGFLVGDGNELNEQVFNSMELYLMGLVPPTAVGTFFVLNNQNATLQVGQTLRPSDITMVTIEDVIAVCGLRVPATTSAQKKFRCATVVLSEQLLDAYAISFYDWFARRAEAKQRLSYASGFATGTCNPFYLATGKRAVMVSKLEDHTASPNTSASFENFESRDFSTFPWQQEGDLPWLITSDQKYAGKYSARAGAIGHGQTSTLKTDVLCSAGSLSFLFKTSTEPGDRLLFKVDGQQKLARSGESGWLKATLAIAGGVHIFEWSYVKDASTSGGQDTVWLDNITFP